MSFTFTVLFFSFLSALYSTQVLAITVVFGFSLLIGSSIRQQIWEKESQNSMVNVFSMDIWAFNHEFSIFNTDPWSDGILYIH